MYKRLKEGVFKLMTSNFLRRLQIDDITDIVALSAQYKVVICSKPFIIAE